MEPHIHAEEEAVRVTADDAEGVTVSVAAPVAVPADDRPVVSETPAPVPPEPDGGQDAEAATEPDADTDA